MTAVYISYSSRDEKFARDITTLIRRLGFEDVFLAFDKDAGIPAGADWERTLYEKIKGCDVSILLLTPNWLSSKWCFAEYTHARALGKIIVPVICTPGEHRYVLSEYQAIDMVDWNTEGIERLEQHLRAIAKELARNLKPAPFVFVSFSSQDKIAALEIVEQLKTVGIRCWISIRDVSSGADFQDAIVAALENAKAMVLVFSQNANNSNEIKKELALASQFRLFVLPVRIENVEPTKGFKYQLATRQYIDLFENREQNMKLVIETLQGYLGDSS